MASLRELEPWLEPYATWFYRHLVRLGQRPTVTSVYRSRAAQEVLYRRYLHGQSKFPAAPPGHSWHEHRRAFDLVVVNPELAGRIWKQMGGSWWASDPIHFQV
jgi:hypothetical protein